MHLVQILFKIGPAKSDGPITEFDIEVYERRRGIDLEPWQADAVIAMSKGYLGETHAAQKNDAPPPWPEAVKMWHYVRHVIAEKSLDKLEEEARYGSS